MAMRLTVHADSEMEEKDAQQHGVHGVSANEEQPNDSSPRKLGLAYILNEGLRPPSAAGLLISPMGGNRALNPSEDDHDEWSISNAAAETEGPCGRPLRRSLSTPSVLTAAAAGVSSPSRETPAASPASSLDKKRGRMCKADGCTNYIVYKGLCCRHGGGKKCSVEGCETSAKHGGRCWRHGGSVECKMPDCTKKAKAKGLCWAHGGGAKCQADACTKVAVSNGFCWAHGGGKRCIFDGCQKPAYGRTHSFCIKHFHELQDVDYYEV